MIIIWRIHIKLLINQLIDLIKLCWKITYQLLSCSHRNFRCWSGSIRRRNLETWWRSGDVNWTRVKGLTFQVDAIRNTNVCLDRQLLILISFDVGRANLYRQNWASQNNTAAHGSIICRGGCYCCCGCCCCRCCCCCPLLLLLPCCCCCCCCCCCGCCCRFCCCCPCCCCLFVVAAATVAATAREAATRCFDCCCPIPVAPVAAPAAALAVAALLASRITSEASSILRLFS